MTTEERPASREEAVERVQGQIMATTAGAWLVVDVRRMLDAATEAIRTELEAAYEAGRVAGFDGLREKMCMRDGVCGSQSWVSQMCESCRVLHHARRLLAEARAGEQR